MTCIPLELEQYLAQDRFSFRVFNFLSFAHVEGYFLKWIMQGLVPFLIIPGNGTIIGPKLSVISMVRSIVTSQFQETEKLSQTIN